MRILALELKGMRHLSVTFGCCIAILLLAGLPIFPQTPTPASSGQQLEALVATEQAALDAKDPAQILTSARELGSLGLQLLGSLYVGAGKCALASDTYRQALSLNQAPEAKSDLLETERLLLMSELCAEHGAGADRVTEQIIQLTGNTAQIHVLLADVRHAAGDLTGDIAELQQAIALAPQLGPAHLALGNAYWELNEYGYNPESLREFTLAQSLLPENFLANENLGSILSQYERYPEAAVYLGKAAQEDGSSPQPWLQLGMNAYAQNHAGEALQALGKAVTLTGSDEAKNTFQIRRAYATLSRLEAQAGHEGEANTWAHREQAVRTTMSSADAALPLSESTGLITDPAQQTPQGNSHTATTGKAPSAEEQAVAGHLKEIVAKSLNDAGTVYARNHDYLAALPLFRLAAADDPDQQPVMRNLGLAAFHTGDYKTAIAAFTHALQQHPDDTLVQNYLDQSRRNGPAGTPSTQP